MSSNAIISRAVGLWGFVARPEQDGESGKSIPPGGLYLDPARAACIVLAGLGADSDCLIAEASFAVRLSTRAKNLISFTVAVAHDGTTPLAVVTRRRWLGGEDITIRAPTSVRPATT
jgi:hypothetical protein